MIPHLSSTNQQSTQGNELLREVRIRSVRRLTLLFGLCVVAGFTLLAPSWPGEQGWQMFVLTATWAAVCSIVYRLADRWLEAAQLLFLAARSGTIMLAGLWLEQPVLLAPAIMIPVIAALWSGWLVGLVAGVALVVLMTPVIL